MARHRRGYGDEYLKNKIELKWLLNGTCLDGMNCHHIVPFFISKDNSIANLCYMKSWKHDSLHREIEKRGRTSIEDYWRLAVRYGAVGMELK